LYASDDAVQAEASEKENNASPPCYVDNTILGVKKSQEAGDIFTLTVDCLIAK
jgi:hypothetical protein